jgi:hypothetical protein
MAQLRDINELLEGGNCFAKVQSIMQYRVSKSCKMSAHQVHSTTFRLTLLLLVASVALIGLHCTALLHTKSTTVLR